MPTEPNPAAPFAPTALDESFSESIEHTIHGTEDSRPTPCAFITGPAGTGKSFSIRAKIAADPSHAVLASTTGISAVNLGAITLNGLLKYFDTESLSDCYISGKLTRILHGLVTGSRGVRNLAIDEVSMLDGEHLDILYRAVGEVNERGDVEEPFGLILTGDFAQLPPIKAKWAFEAECWPEFERATVTLTQTYRQSDPTFLAALNAIRRGDGPEGAALLRETPTTFASATDNSFDGTTILGKNDQVDRYNWLRYSKLAGKEIKLDNSRWGREPGEWKNIPPSIALKPGALVMILANDTRGGYAYANGDLGHFEEMTTMTDAEGETVDAAGVILHRTGEAAIVPQVSRANTAAGSRDERPPEAKGSAGANFDPRLGKWVIGRVTFWPLRLAYASTVHKTQGLSLDRVQIDPRDAFYGQPSMVYVATSRCRTPEGLRIIGGADLMGKRVKTDPKIRRWL